MMKEITIRKWLVFISLRIKSKNLISNKEKYKGENKNDSKKAKL